MTDIASIEQEDEIDQTIEKAPLESWLHWDAINF